MKTHRHCHTLWTLAIASALLGITKLAAAAGVSPGAADRFAVVEGRCPTFSWEAAAETDIYELVVYALPDWATPELVSELDLDTDSEVLYVQVPGGATVWTPAADQGLTPAGRFVWFVRGVVNTEHEEQQPGEWSEGLYFATPARSSVEDVGEALEVLRLYLEAGDGHFGEADLGAEIGQILARTTPRSGSAGVPKSVPNATAAIRGSQPDGAGETYGVAGTSASPQGAGVGAANTAGGADLVLDGSADGETDTLLSQSGLDRPSVFDERFYFRNTGAGLLDLHVMGDIFGETIFGDEIYTASGMVIDDAGNWLGAGNTVPCASCVSSTDIADGTIIHNDLARDSVTESKIEGGAVSNLHLQSGSVTSNKILDGTITAADIDPAAALEADTLDGQHGAYYRNAATLNAGTVATARYSAVADLAAEGLLDNNPGSIAQNNRVVQRDLNADHLDGQHGAYYRDAANLNAGTVSTSRYSAISDLNAEGYLGDVGGDLAQNNGILQASLNADRLDGNEGSYYQPQVIHAGGLEWGILYLTDVCTDYRTLTVDTSGPGTLVITTEVSFAIVASSSTYESVHIDVWQTAGVCDPQEEVRWGSGSSSVDRMVQLTQTRRFTISSGGSHTYYLNAEQFNGHEIDTDFIARMNMIGVFYPN